MFIQISTRLPSQYVYGFGETEHTSFRRDMNWNTWGMFAKDQPPGYKLNSYGVHPFYMGLENDGNAHGVLLLNSNAMDVTFQPTPALTYRTIGGILDFYMVLGPTPELVVQEYTALIGRPVMPPYWALGFQLCRYGYKNDTEVSDLYEAMKAAQIPYDVQYTDIDYMERQLDFTLSPNFSGLPALINKMKMEGMRFIIILDPAISGNETDYLAYTRGVQDDVFIKWPNSSDIVWGKVWPDLPNVVVNESLDWDTQVKLYRAYAAFPDFFRNTTAQWWQREIREYHTNPNQPEKSVKFDGLWIDMNEPSNFVHGAVEGCRDQELNNPPYMPSLESQSLGLSHKTLCMESQQLLPDGTPVRHYDVHNLYGWSHAKPTYDALQNVTKERGIIITRSTYPSSGKWAGHWLGDNTAAWNQLYKSIIGMMEFSLFGISYTGADICGFFNDAEYYMCVRWMQLGAFYPFSRNHNGKGSKRQDPVAFDERFENISRNVLNTRYTLLPYLYTLMYEAHAHGSTVVRPVLHEFVEDKTTWDVYTQFLWGPALLISPVLKNDTSVLAYIPNASWYDYYTDENIVFRGQFVNLSAPLEHINLHIRGGYIIPWQYPANNTFYSRQNSMGLTLALDDNGIAQGQLYWDDGNSIDAYERGAYLLETFNATQNVLEINVLHNGYTDPNNLKFSELEVLGVPSVPSAVTVKQNGVTIPSLHSISYNGTKQVLHVTGLQLDLGKPYTVEWSIPVVQDNEKFNCYPDLGASQENCKARGCIWEVPSNSLVPSCFYPSNYGYSVSNVQNTTLGLTADLFIDPSIPDRYGEHSLSINMLRLEVKYHDDNMLQFKIYDANTKRYEVPVPLFIPDPSSTEAGRLYEVTIKDNPFGIQIRRRSTGTIIWDSQVPGFTFSDMFIQISTRLPSQYVYGFGETEHTTYRRDMNWNTWGMFAKDQSPGYKLNSYGVHPFYMGLEDDGNAHGVLLLNSNAMDVTFQPTPALTYRTIGGILDFYMVLGPTPELVVQEYTALIGRPVMPPYWSLGFQLCRYGYQNDTEVADLYEAMKTARIPYDVQFVDIDYMNRKLDFTLSPKFSGLPALINQIKDEGMRFIIILDPPISGNETSDYSAFTRGVQQDVFIKWPNSSEIVWTKVWPDYPNVVVNDSADLDTQIELYRAYAAFPDFFRNSTAQWWQREIVEFYSNPKDPAKSMKFDGLWTDMNEPASFINGAIGGCREPLLNKPPYMPPLAEREKGLNLVTLCMESEQFLPDGTPVRHYDVHSLYGWSQAQPTYNAIQNATGERGIVITRSTYPSSGRWVGHWLGDNYARWDQLEKSIIGIMEFGLFGITYIGADICGFFNDTTYELCARWMQLGSFYTFSRNHNVIGTMRQDPVSFDEKFKNISRDVVNTRYKLLPYLYSLMHEAHAYGGTVTRPLLHEFVEDKTTWDIYKQFLWGPALLISPVLDPGATEVNAYVPNARWYDYYTGTDLGVRGEFHTLKAPLEHINLHIRGGYIIPWQEPGLNTNQSRQNSMGLTVALDDNGVAQGQLFWDDGISIDTYENGSYFLAKFSASQNVLEIKVQHNGYTDPNNLKFSELQILGVPSVPSAVTVKQNGVTIPSLHSISYNGTKQVLHVTGLQLDLGKPYTVEWSIPVVEDNEKFNCYPDLGASQENCKARGCIWEVASNSLVPSCYYPNNYGYSVSNVQNTTLGLTADLFRDLSIPDRYGERSPSINMLRLEVKYHDDNMLQFKIFDANTKRYEVPVPLFIPDPSSTEAGRLYEVTIKDNPFGIQIRRRSTGTIIWDSQVPGFTFSDMFIQISTRLPSQYVYGFGETEHTTYRRDMNWNTWGMFTKDQSPGYKLNSYGVHPFYMGLEDDGNAHGVLLLNSNAMDVTFQPTPALTYRTIGGILDFYMVLGPTPELVVQEYTALIGRPVMPPYWSLGFQLCRYGYQNDTEVADLYEAMKTARIPYDVQFVDVDYMNRKLDFTLSPKFSGLPALINQIKDEGMRFIIILDPPISGNETSDYSAFTRGVQQDVFIKWPNSSEIVWTKVWPDYPNVVVNDSADLDTQIELYRAYAAFPDFFRNSTAQWWQREIVEFYSNPKDPAKSMKFDGLWTDMNEPASFINGAIGGCREPLLNKPPYMPPLAEREKGLNLVTLCMESEQFLPDGTPVRHYDVHSLYGWSQAQPTYNAIQNATGERGIVITRSTYPSSGRWVGHWLGDNYARWDQLEKSIIGIMEFGLFGITYIGADICGFFNDTTYELCARWMQLGSFYTFSRNHNVIGTMRQDPVSFDEKFKNISRDVVNTRYKLLPYLYSLMHEAHAYGGTVTRPLLHEFVEDKTTWDIYKQFLWGPALLISPVLDPGATEVNAYVPNARWYDYYTGTDLGVRGEFHTLKAPLEHINLHIRGGYIIPWQEPGLNTNQSRQNSMGLTVALDDNGVAQGQLFWDDGISIDTYENGSYFLAKFSASQNVLEIKVQHNGYTDPNNLKFSELQILGVPSVPSAVTVKQNGVTIPSLHSISYNGTKQVLHVTGLQLDLGKPYTVEWSIPVVEDNEKFNCYPDLGASQENCKARGCIWEVASNSLVPSCYYPNNYGYSVSNVQNTTLGLTADLFRDLSIPDRYGERSPSINMLRLEVKYHDDNMLQFKIFDANTKRYEVPVPLFIPDPSSTEAGRLYEVTIKDNPFGIQIRRRSTGTIIWDSQVPGFTFSDMFIQISTRLPSQYVYGFGETEHTTYRRDMNWNTWGMFTKDQSPGYKLNSYGVHPFYMGLEDDGNAHGVLLLNSNAMDVTFQPTPALTYRTIGGILDFYMVLGPTPELVVQEYTALIGRPVMPPYWSLGFQLCRYGYQNDTEVADLYEAMKTARIPYDVQFVDVDYMNRKLDFTLSPKFSGLPALINQIKDEGMRFIIILDPPISGNETSDYSAFTRGVQQDVFIKWPNSSEIVWTKVWPDYPNVVVNDSADLDTQIELYRAYAAFPDFFRNSTAQWWQREIVEFYSNPKDPAKSMKFDGLWTDMNEPASFINGAIGGCREPLLNKPPYMPPLAEREKGLNLVTLCMESEQFLPDGTPVRHYDVHSLYGWSQAQPTYNAIQNATGERGIVITRSTYPSSGRWVGHWLGDNYARWDQLEKSIIGIMEFGLFGITYIGADICGFFNDTTYELCARWMQLGSFYTFSRNHNVIGTMRQDPVSFDEKFKNISRDVVNTRYKLLPYLYSLMHEAHAYGGTVTRPLLHEFVEDKTTWDIYKQFLWGPALLISPVLDPGATEVNAYVPNARWYDYYTGTDLGVRGEFHTLKAPLEHINLHIRGGYIIPWQEPGLNTNQSRQNSMGLTVALDDNGVAQGQLFWDDGISIDTYENGSYFLAKFSASQNVLEIKVQHNGYTDPNNLKFSELQILGVPSVPSAVTVKQNGVTVPSLHSISYNGTKQVLHVTGLQLDLGKPYTVEWSIPVVEDNEKFNCYPDLGASQENCKARGCIWEVASNSLVPSCYYPNNYGYSVSNVQNTTLGLTADLFRDLSIPDRYGERSPSINMLHLEVKYHDDNMLQFKIFDANTKRYEVPVPLFIPDPSSTEAGRLYEVTIKDNPFGIQIRRRSTGTIIWDSQVPGFTFSDMFIQISTRLPSQYVYGFGETEHTTYRRDMNWNTWGMFTKDQSPGYKLNSYGVHPFYMGLEDDGNAHGVLLLNSNAMDVTFQPTPALTYRTIGGILDFYMVLGPTPELVVQEYTALIGRPVMPPYWSLGFQLCRYGYQNDTEVADLYEAMKTARIPYDVQFVDVDYMNRKLDFTLSPKFSGLPALINQIKDEGMRFIIILDPPISGNETSDYSAFTRGVQQDVFIKWPNSSEIVWTKVWPDYPNVVVNDSADLDTQIELYRAYAAFPDFFRNSTAQWWQREIVEFYSNPKDPAKSMKFDGLWTDMNEPASFINGAIGGCREPLLNKPPYMPPLAEREKGLNLVTLCMESEQFLPDGTPVRHYDVHSLYGWSQAQPTYNAIQNATGERGIVITRSTYPSSGRWVGHWLGDNYARWDQLEKSIIGIMEFGLFGITYIGADICGFFNDTTYELCARWMQLGSFYTFSRNHNVIGTMRQDPVSFDEKFKNISRDVVNTRYKLLPYLYTLMHEAHAYGGTVTRPLLHEFVEDKKTWDIYKQFLWGPALLISPVLDPGATEVNAYVPNARWYDYYTGTDLGVRGEFHTLKAPLEHINLHIRGGYIIPWQEPGLNTNQSRQNSMGLTVALDDNGVAQGQLFWDDGVSIDTYENGSYFLAKFSASQHTVNITVIHNEFLTDTNPLKFGYMNIWGIGNQQITNVTATYGGQTHVITDFSSNQTSQVLEINFTEKIFSIEKFTQLQWTTSN
ncbi:sucrase-isomaltase, intestinal isoform X2 [Carettochelys insculpta]